MLMIILLIKYVLVLVEYYDEWYNELKYGVYWLFFESCKYLILLGITPQG